MNSLNFDLKWAQTLDGQLCDDSGNSKWISGTEELRRTHEIRKSYDAILVGAKTFVSDRARLTIRMVPIPSDFPQPVRIILDLKNSIETILQSEENDTKKTIENIREDLSSTERPTIILVGAFSGLDKCFRTEPFFDLHCTNSIFVPIDLNFELEKTALSKDLYKIFGEAFYASEAFTKRNIKDILVEGGSRTLKFFIDNDLYRYMFVSIATTMTGGLKNRIEIKKLLSDAKKFSVLYFQMLGEDILLKLTPQVRSDVKQEAFI